MPNNTALLVDVQIRNYNKSSENWNQQSDIIMQTIK